MRVHVLSAGDVDLNGDFVADSELNASIAKSTLQFAEDLTR